MSYISQLNLLGDDLPPISEETLSEELSFWANAQFTFDTPGPSMLEDAIKQPTFDVFDCLVDLNDMNHVQHISLLPPAQPAQSTQPATRNLPTLLPRIYPASSQPSVLDCSVSVPKKRKEPVKQNPVEKVIAVEDKRKRNTAASARFRMKKKMREHELEQQTTEMTKKTEELESRVKGLEQEIKWLRSLIVEKDPSLLEERKYGR
ncbi:hypothetical protein J3Q64DRAFT_1765352 [Phycomyces blakesleeanus]|uniref:BZIP domain-containing protein n=1 Tax=Phycomyces blakesleeanus TaxID=4837 RepID=A0ABR3APR7_PHYBL